MHQPVTQKEINGLILAGGRGRRMQDRDKGLVELDQYTLIQHVISQLAPQVSGLYISANRNLELYRQTGYPVLIDDTPDYAGPMAGILRGVQENRTDWLIVSPCDTPFLPTDFVYRMQNRINETNARVCIADIENRLQPVHLLLHTSVKESLQNAIAEGKQKMQLWLKEQNYCLCDFSDQATAFYNINTMAELEAARRS